MAPRVRIEGLATAVKKIETLARAGGQANVSGMRVVGETIMTDVKANRSGAGVPRDTGALAASGRVTGPDAHGAVELTFGGAAAPYALVQHEDLTLRHTVGEARYLTRGMERFQAGGGANEALKQMADEAIAKAKRA